MSIPLFFVMYALLFLPMTRYSQVESMSTTYTSNYFQRLSRSLSRILLAPHYIYVPRAPSPSLSLPYQPAARSCPARRPVPHSACHTDHRPGAALPAAGVDPALTGCARSRVGQQ